MKSAVKLLSGLAIACLVLLGSAVAELVDIPVYVENFDGSPAMAREWLKKVPDSGYPRGTPWEATGGEYVYPLNDQEWAITAYPEELGDFSVEFNMAAAPRAHLYGPWVGIRCDKADSLLRIPTWATTGAGYGLVFRPLINEDVELTKVDAGSLAGPVAIGPGPYHVKIVAVGANIKVYIDGNLIFDYTDPAPVLVGYFGFESRQSTTSIDNVKISGLTEVAVPQGAQGPQGAEGPQGAPADDTVRSDAEIFAVVGPHTVKYTDAEAITAVLPQVGAALVAHSGDANVHHVPTVDTDTVRSDAEIIALRCAFKKGKDCPKGDDDDDDDE